MAMLGTFSRTRHADDHRREQDRTRVDDTITVDVHVGEGLAPLATVIAARLGPGFDVTVGPPAGRDIAVVAALGREATAFFHARHPDTLLLVVKRGATGHV